MQDDWALGRPRTVHQQKNAVSGGWCEQGRLERTTLGTLVTIPDTILNPQSHITVQASKGFFRHANNPVDHEEARAVVPRWRRTALCRRRCTSPMV